MCYIIKLIEQCCFGSQISKSSSVLRNRNRLKLSQSHVLKLGISLSFDKKYFARKSLSFRNIFAILIRIN